MPCVKKKIVIDITVLTCIFISKGTNIESREEPTGADSSMPQCRNSDSW